MQEDKTIEEYIREEDFEKEGGVGWKKKLFDLIDGKYFVPIVITLIAIIAFSLGRVSGLQDKRPPVRVISEVSGEVRGASINNSLPTPASVSTNSGAVVASKSGTKYHYPWCAGAKQISAKNLITFNSIEEARAAGYTPASNCKGLK